MQFKKVFHGYEPSQVDQYIKQQNEQSTKLQAEQRERIAELLEQNAHLSERLKQFETEEKAISKSLVESQKLAQELKNDATRYSELVLSRARIFYAAWHTYAETLVATLSPEEVSQLRLLEEKIGKLIANYQGDENTVAQPAFASVNNVEQCSGGSLAGEQSAEKDRAEQSVSCRKTDLKPSEKTMNTHFNPIEKLQDVSGATIDLKELVSTDESLEDLCSDLGLNVTK